MLWVIKWNKNKYQVVIQISKDYQIWKIIWGSNKLV